MKKKHLEDVGFIVGTTTGEYGIIFQDETFHVFNNRTRISAYFSDGWVSGTVSGRGIFLELQPFTTNGYKRMPRALSQGMRARFIDD